MAQMKPASGMERRDLRCMVLPCSSRYPLLCLELKAPCSWDLWSTDELGRSNISAWAYCCVTFSPLHKGFLGDFWLSRSLAPVWLTAVSYEDVSFSTEICSPGTGIRSILERALKLSQIKERELREAYIYKKLIKDHGCPGLQEITPSVLAY